MKNSSMFEPKMARNFNRSSRGLRSSSASSEDAPLELEQTSSRLIYREGEERSTGSDMLFLYRSLISISIPGVRSHSKVATVVLVMQIIRRKMTDAAPFFSVISNFELSAVSSPTSELVRLVPYDCQAVHRMFFIDLADHKLRVSQRDQVVAKDELVFHFEHIGQDLGGLTGAT